MAAKKKTQKSLQADRDVVKAEGPQKKAGAAKKKQSAKKTGSEAVPRGAKAGEGKAGQDFPIVGIGASAGGLEAIEGFFSGVPSDINAAFVIVQHLPPRHKSMMGSILEKYTRLPIEEAKDAAVVKPGRVYLNPPDKDLSIKAGRLRLTVPTEPRGVRRPIDSFFRSLAEALGDKSICVVLSGTGADGTSGLKAVKEADGMAMVQKESQARYDGMPRSAIDTGLVDYVLEVEKMGGQLARYIEHPYIGGVRGKAAREPEDVESCLRRIFVQIRSVTGNDFSQYKRTTIHRRIDRRMAVHQIERLADYVRYIEEHADEAKALFKDLLITVTSFFRDAKAYEALDEKVITPLVNSEPADGTIRVWVPGCATGEEAYSVAILFCEAMRQTKKLCRVQIFATDIDLRAIECARKASYREDIAADISAERLARYFTREDSAYKVRKPVREMVVFATHNVIKDAPFSRLDLVCCRNLLIYMEADLQKKVLPLFHYTLNPGGYLFLGTSETIGDASDRFAVVDSTQAIFRRKEGRPYGLPHHAGALRERKEDMQQPQRKALPGANIRELAERTILRTYAPPCVLVDENFDILYFHGDTEKFLKLPEGEPGFNILKMTREELRYILGGILQKASTEKTETASGPIAMTWQNEVMTTNVVVRPFSEVPAEEGLLLVIFEILEPAGKEASPGGKRAAAKARRNEPRIEALERELKSTKEHLHSTIEELETSNEELQSTNEELQSTNEELETSREELESTNEELRTVNSELQAKVEELSSANDDLNNLLGAEIAAIFLDNELRVKRFTPKTSELFKLIASDVGRPISDIANTLDYKDVVKDMKEVAKNLGKVEKEVQTTDGRWFIFRVLPYRTAAGAAEGVAVTLVDITGQKNSQIEARGARDFAESIVETVRQPLVVLDKNLRVISINKSFCRVFEVEAADSQGKLIYDLGNRQWDIPELRRLLEEILPKNTQFNDFEVEHEFPKIGRKKMRLNARRLAEGGEGTEKILLAIEEISD